MDDQRFVVTANFTPISAQTTLQTLGMPFSFPANTHWEWMLLLLVTAANATMDVKVGPVTQPTGSTMRYGASDRMFGGVLLASTPVGAIANGSLAFGTPAGTTGLMILGELHGATAGTFDLGYAQNTSDAGNLTVLKGTLLRLARTA